MSQDKDARIAELERKLAEQQATVKNFFGMYARELPDVGEELNKLLAQAKEKGFVAGSLNAGFAHALDCNEAFNKGKEEGKKEAVPEGWQVVPVNLSIAKPVLWRYEVLDGVTSYWPGDKPNPNVTVEQEPLYAAPKPEGETK